MMLIPLFSALSVSDYVEITSENAGTVIGGPKAAFVKFYSLTCHHCRAMAEDFDEASTAFADVVFGGVECGANGELCNVHNVTGYPTIYLFKPGSQEGIQFDKTRSVDGFCDFIEEFTKIKPKRQPSNFTDFNPINFEKQIATYKCLLVTFYAPWCGHSKRWLGQARIVARAMVPEPNVSVALSNCDQYHELCDQNEIKGYPTIKLYVNGTIIPYTEPRSAQSALWFLNDNCGTERDIDGLLNSTAGLIPDAGPIVTEFLANPSASVIEKMKTVPGADFYVKVMQRYQTGGPEQLKKDMATISGILDLKRGSWPSLDGMKRRFNVFAQFVPTPKPSPSPDEHAPTTEAVDESTSSSTTEESIAQSTVESTPIPQPAEEPKVGESL